MSNSIDKPLSDLLKSTDIVKINIPIFQRPYSWGNTQINQYLIDLKTAAEKDETHFFGLVVYVFDKNKNRTIELIDGQQRITTAIITLAVIRDLMEDLNKNCQWNDDDSERNNEALNNVKTAIKVKKETKLTTSNEEKFERDFIEIIQNAILDFTNLNESPRKDYEDQKIGSKNRFEAKRKHLENKGNKNVTRSKNSYKNYISIHKEIWSQLEKLATNEEKFHLLIKYSDTLLENFRYIPFLVESYEKAFEYFEVLNDRGLEISALDLIKNECLKKDMSEKERNEIFELWTEIFSKTLDESFNLIQFIRYAHMQKKGHITKKEIYNKYKEELRKMGFVELKTFLNNELLIKAKIYKDFQIHDTSLLPKFHNAIQLLRSTKTIQWYSIAMSLLEPLYTNKKLSTNVQNKIILLIETIHEIMFSINFISIGTNTIETEFPKIAQKIKFKSEKEFLKQINETSKDLNEIKTKYDLSFRKIDITKSSIFETNNDLGSMLIFLLKYYQKKTSDDKFSIGSLEHLFPQKQSTDKWPIINSLSKEEQKEMIYSVGNFYITNSTLNSVLGNKSFKDKLKIYQNWNIHDVIQEPNQLNYNKVKNWDLSIVKKRSKKIFEEFEKLALSR